MPPMPKEESDKTTKENKKDTDLSPVTPQPKNLEQQNHEMLIELLKVAKQDRMINIIRLGIMFLVVVVPIVAAVVLAPKVIEQVNAVMDAIPRTSGSGLLLPEGVGSGNLLKLFEGMAELEDLQQQLETMPPVENINGVQQQ